MKVWITLDYFDGSSSKATKKPVHLDEVDLHGILLLLNEANVAGVTFTRSDVLNRVGRLTNQKGQP